MQWCIYAKCLYHTDSAKGSSFDVTLKDLVTVYIPTDRNKKMRPKRLFEGVTDSPFNQPSVKTILLVIVFNKVTLEKF